MKKESLIRIFLLIPCNIMAIVLVYLGTRILQTNLLGWFLVLFGLAYILGGVYFRWKKDAPLVSKSSRAVKDEEGDRSFCLILPGFVAVFFASPIEYLYLGGAVRAGILAEIVGLMLVLFGIALRLWTRVTMKDQYTGHIQTIAGGVLQTGGPYH